MTAIGCAFVGIVIATLLPVSPAGAERIAEVGAAWFAILVCLTIVVGALFAGRRFSDMAGAIGIVAMAGAIGVGLAAVTNLTDFVTPVLLVPIASAYAGWTFSPWRARALAGAVLVMITVGLLANSTFREALAAYPWGIAFGYVVSFIIAELSIALAEDMRAYSLVDPLTGALNRRGLTRRMRELRRRPGQAWVVAADLNGLKAINDRLGHAEGDQVLRESVEGWARALPDGGLVTRWGGDEFVLVFPAADEAAARAVIVDLRRACPHAFAAGLAPLDGALDDAVLAADPELYADKRRTAPVAAAVETPRDEFSTGRLGVLARQTTYTRVWILAGLAFAASAYTAALVTISPVGAAISAVNGSVSVAFAIAAGLAGSRFPRGAVLAWITVLAAAAMAHAVFTDQPGALFQAMFGMPLVAVVLATFYPPRAARGIAAAFLAALSGAVLIAPTLVPAVGVAPLVVSAATAWLLLEVVVASSASLRRTASSDPLTGALNRLGLAHALPRLEARARRRRAPLSVAAIDFDHFKVLNDTHGHARGDAALRGAVAQWRADLRAGDLIARVGGDEFVVVLPGTDAEAAGHLMARLRDGAADPWTWGIAEVSCGEGVDHVLHRADQALGARKALRGTARPSTREG
nr:GGDEF domain-containing protein [Microbacterium sp. ZXX196]